MRIKLFASLFIFVLLFPPLLVQAEGTGVDFYKARVQDVVEQHVEGSGADARVFQTVELDNPAGVIVEYGYDVPVGVDAGLSVGQHVVLSRIDAGDGESVFVVSDVYRLPSLYLILFLFLALTVWVAGKQGARSFVGLLLSILVLVLWVIPQIAGGANPAWTSFGAALVISTLTIFISHGANRRSALSWVATLLTITVAFAIAELFVQLTQLTGLGTEDALFLYDSPADAFKVRGLLLGGIIIGTLGILDDIITTQVATVFELKRANAALHFKELYHRGVNVGREHVAALINTLALAYFGASFPLFFLFQQKQEPLWVVFNSEFIMEEVVRTLVGSSALIIAVPCATALAAYVFAQGLQHDEEHEKVHTH